MQMDYGMKYMGAAMCFSTTDGAKRVTFFIDYGE
jgi:hypothetical protein